jgi:hypothetical protein
MRYSLSISIVNILEPPMFIWREFVLSLLLLFGASCTLATSQSAVQRYRDAAKVFRDHTQGDFLHDDSPAGIAALQSMWSASAESVVQLISRNPDATSKDVEAALCDLPSSAGDCGEKEGAQRSAVALEPHLFLASQFSGEAGTVFVVGMHAGKAAQLWSIDSAAPEKADPQGLLGAWRADRAGGHCREKDSGHPPGTCGPLYADVGLLTPDAGGRPRFYIDAGYAQIMGATVGHQTSVWRWDGETAHLQWIDWHDFMIDQKIGTEFKNGVISIGEKDDFRSFYGCGGCEARQMVRRIRVTPTGVEDLGKVSTTPELDLIDELFWRLANDRPTEDIAAPEVSRLLRPQIATAKEDSKKIDPKWFSTGMLGDVFIKRDGEFEQVCFTVDGDIGRLYFSLKHAPGIKPRIVKVSQPNGEFGDCPR